MLPVHLINLGKDIERRTQATRQLDQQGVSYEIFDALNGDQGRATFDQIDDHGFVLRTGRRYTPGEIGCFASHKALWQRCVEQNSALLIMEDDFALAPEFSGAVAAAGELVDTLGLIRLQDERRGKSTKVMPFAGFQLERYTKTPHCTLCYAISPEVARKLVALHADFCAPVDVVLKHVWEYDNAMYCLQPYTVSSSELSFDSVIRGREKCPKSPLRRARRFWLKTTWQWQRVIFNLRQRDGWIRQRFQAKRKIA